MFGSKFLSSEVSIVMHISSSAFPSLAEMVSHGGEALSYKRKLERASQPFSESLKRGNSTAMLGYQLELEKDAATCGLKTISPLSAELGKINFRK